MGGTAVCEQRSSGSTMGAVRAYQGSFTFGTLGPVDGRDAVASANARGTPRPRHTTPGRSRDNSRNQRLRRRPCK